MGSQMKLGVMAAFCHIIRECRKFGHEGARGHRTPCSQPLGLLRPLRGSAFGLGQPDAFGAGESRGRPAAGGYSFEDPDRAAKRRHSQSRSVGRADFDFTIDCLAAIGEKMNILLG